MNRLPLYILAGGRSTRFGSDKARATLDGEPLICRVGRLAQAAASSVTVVADRADKYTDLGFRTIPDRHGGLGPLAGLQTALMDLPEDQHWLLLCPCDAVVIQTHWLRQLLTAREEGVGAVAFRASGRWQPMPGLYAKSALSHIDAQLQNDQRSMQQLLDRLRTAALPLPADWPERWQANTPADLERLRE